MSNPKSRTCKIQSHAPLNLRFLEDTKKDGKLQSFLYPCSIGLTYGQPPMPLRYYPPSKKNIIKVCLAFVLPRNSVLHTILTVHQEPEDFIYRSIPLNICPVYPLKSCLSAFEASQPSPVHCQLLLLVYNYLQHLNIEKVTFLPVRIKNYLRHLVII